MKTYKGRTKVTSACDHCKRSHAACDEFRPCTNCIRSKRADLCTRSPNRTTAHSIPGSSTISWLAYTRLPLESPSLNLQIAPRNSRPCTLFVSTSLCIARATAASEDITGFLPGELVDTPLQRLIHPDDVAAVEGDVKFLTRNTRLPGELHSRYAVVSTLADPSLRHSYHDFRLAAPAEGMYEPYPNRYVRIKCGEGHREYHMCLYVGGALGTSLWRPESYGQSYIVITIRPVQHLLYPRGSHSVGLSQPLPDFNSVLPSLAQRLKVDVRETGPIITQPRSSPALPSISSVLKQISHSPPRWTDLPIEEISSWREKRPGITTRRSEADLALHRHAGRRSRA